MRFRTFMLFILLFSQPLAAFDLNCGMPGHEAASGTPVSDEHCSSHANVGTLSAGDLLDDSLDTSIDDQQPSGEHHPAGHAGVGGHCQFCASGAFVLPVVMLGENPPFASRQFLPIAEPAPQFLSRPLFRPPIR